MQFDIRTLLVAVALATAFCAAARVLLWRMHPTLPGLGRWAAAGGFGALALLLIAARGIIPEAVSFSSAQVLIASGFTLGWDGFRRFLGRPPLPPRVVALIAAAVLIPIAVSHAADSLTLRALSNALLIALLSALIARELSSAARPDQIALRATAWVYAANALFFLLRAIAALRGAAAEGPLNPDGLAALPLFWWLCVTVAVTLGMVLMTGERLQRDLDRQASSDPLTGALNRRAFAAIAQREVARARRSGGPLSLLMMDLDHFKAINDSLGHCGGDDILRRFVRAADHVLRTEDVFCRYGGEEFVALLPGTTVEQAYTVAERLRLLYTQEAGDNLPRALPFALTVSVGIDALRAGEDIDEALHRADAALYRAKANGRNRCELAKGGAEACAGAVEAGS